MAGRHLITVERDDGVCYVTGSDEDTVLIGRASMADLRLVDAAVSALHLKVILGSGTVHVQDLGSKNGTWLDDARLPAQSVVQVRSGSVVNIGATFRLSFGTGEPPLSTANPFAEHDGADDVETAALHPAALAALQERLATRRPALPVTLSPAPPSASALPPTLGERRSWPTEPGATTRPRVSSLALPKAHPRFGTPPPLHAPPPERKGEPQRPPPARPPEPFPQELRVRLSSGEGWPLFDPGKGAHRTRRPRPAREPREAAVNGGIPSPRAVHRARRRPPSDRRPSGSRWLVPLLVALSFLAVGTVVGLVLHFVTSHGEDGSGLPRKRRRHPDPSSHEQASSPGSAIVP